MWGDGDEAIEVYERFDWDRALDIKISRDRNALGRKLAGDQEKDEVEGQQQEADQQDRDESWGGKRSDNAVAF